MINGDRPGGAILSVLLRMLPGAADHAAWRDPSPHSVRFVTMDDGVRLEVIDWGGSGRAVVLLAGGGNTAHVFDDLAPQLAGRHRVYGITRRGWGASGFSEAPNPVDRLRADLLAALDALGLERPVLVGHSIAGAEMSALANSHPSRLAGLVYLDAAYPYAFDDGSGRTMREFDPPKALWHPSPGAPDLEGFRSLQAWDERVDGFPTPEAEFHELWEWDAGGEVLKRRNFLGGRVFSTILTEGTRYTRIPAPALALYALPHTPEDWIRKSTDPAVQKAARAYFATIDALTEKQARAFERLVPGARVVRMPGSHYLFLSNAPEVLRQVRTFIDGLR